MLSFEKAIEIVERPPLVPHDMVMDYLRKNAPEIAALVEKDMTAGDVHATTALGNDGDKKPKKTFAEKMADMGVTGVEVDKSDGDRFALPIQIIKVEPTQQLIFGWASISTKDGMPIIDKQGDVIMPDDLEKAAYDFNLYARTQGDMHTRIGTGRLVESMVFTKQKQAVLGIDLGLEGWWTGFKVDDPKLWEAHKRGERPEFSIGGRGERVDMATA